MNGLKKNLMFNEWILRIWKSGIFVRQSFFLNQEPLLQFIHRNYFEEMSHPSFHQLKLSHSHTKISELIVFIHILQILFGLQHKLLFWVITQKKSKESFPIGDIFSKTFFAYMQPLSD